MTGAAWIASYVALWVAVLVLSFAVVVLLRQIGVLHARIRPAGVHPAGEGPVHGAPAPAVGWFDYDQHRLTVLVFAAASCDICQELVPSLPHLRRQYRDIAVEVIDHAPDTTGVFSAFNVSSTPYVVMVDRGGTVRAGGVANSLEQIEVEVQAALAGTRVDAG